MIFVSKHPLNFYMTTRKRIKKLLRLHSLIKRKSTGNPTNLACKLEISPATLYRYLNDLKNEGAAIKYSKDRGSYYFEKEHELKFY
ncbi:MAG: HTH domain-containing protein [Saprospiraceae bacterium]